MTVVRQAPLSMDFPGKNGTAMGCHVLLQRIFTHLGIEPAYPALQADSLLRDTGEAQCFYISPQTAPWDLV